MLKDFSSIKLQGANFSSETILPLFKEADNKWPKISLLYGRNGSGKSTIAKAFRKIKGEVFNTIFTADSLNTANLPTTLSENDRDHIFVFDEDFVTSNVRIEGRGLGSIVMLGEQADLTVQIKQAEIELKEAQDLYNNANDTFEEYQSNTNPKSPLFYINKIYKTLQSDNGWAGRDSKVRGLRQNSRVTNDTYKKFIEQTPDKSRDELIVAFTAKIQELEDAKSGTSKITAIVPVIPNTYVNYSITVANKLIKTKIEKPELSDREKYLFSLITTGQAEKLQNRIDYFSSEKHKFCPYCLQDLTSNYKIDLVTRMQQLLTDEVKHHQTLLKTMKTSELVLDLSFFSSLPSFQTCISLIKTINNTILANNSLLQRKIDDSYSPIIDKELSGISEEINALSDALKTLEEERTAHNSRATDTKPIMDTLISINNQIAYYDVIELSRQLEVQNNEMADAKNKCDEAFVSKEQKIKLLDELNGRRKNIDIAIDIINNGLKFIFFSEDRLTIERDGDLYKLLSKGHPVLPKDISVGERNILGLCYFFTSILNGKNKVTGYSDEYLIAIDDPISSYDFENKIGILSFLKFKLGQFLNANASSRVVVMTHDILTLLDLDKICHELSKDWSKIFPAQEFKYNLWELKNCSLIQFLRNRQEYTELLKLVYNYGCGKVDEYDIVIGNIMRQVLEAYATFEFKKGIAEVSTDEELLSNMSPEHKSYFKNLMYRIVLNNGSHKQEQTQSMALDFLSVISEAEKRRTAQEVISFIYLLNAPHIIAHLGNDVKDTVKTWCDAIKSRAAVI